MGIATDYHINETPMMEQDHFKHLDENVTYLTAGRLVKGGRPAGLS